MHCLVIRPAEHAMVNVTSLLRNSRTTGVSLHFSKPKSKHLKCLWHSILTCNSLIWNLSIALMWKYLVRAHSKAGCFSRISNLWAMLKPLVINCSKFLVQLCILPLFLSEIYGSDMLFESKRLWQLPIHLKLAWLLRKIVLCLRSYGKWNRRSPKNMSLLIVYMVLKLIIYQIFLKSSSNGIRTVTPMDIAQPVLSRIPMTHCCGYLLPIHWPPNS